MANVQVVVLNGSSSAGKSSVAKALQRLAAKPFLHVAMDHFLDMLPERTLNHPDGITFQAVGDGDPPETAVFTGEVVERALSGMRRAVAALAGAGNHVIVDDVMLSGHEADDYRALLGDVDLRLVGLHAPLEVLEARERQRGDRHLGQARWQHLRVHHGLDYDLELDTSLAAPDELARRIRDAFGL
ncbi:chloramphenicol phosphotransferase CPT family protein [Phenylobacterium sp.]|uniref:chloramphenicol phosphotransferase CPT family protein n=1 Tax=Phenylobacterium sp. TaxID=1871053 RepID=UPI0035B21FE0